LVPLGVLGASAAQFKVWFSPCLRGLIIVLASLGVLGGSVFVFLRALGDLGGKAFIFLCALCVLGGEALRFIGVHRRSSAAN
jgi:hypothetical protein